MKEICSTKIIRKKSKPGIEYPFLRLSKEYLHLVGERVNIFEVIHNNLTAFLIVPSKGVEQPESYLDIPARVTKIEAEVSELKDILKNSNGLEEIRTPDLRHVKATS